MLEKVAAGAAHGGFKAAMTSDPAMLSKVIFEWWWVDCNYRARIYDLSKPGADEPLWGRPLDAFGLGRENPEQDGGSGGGGDAAVRRPADRSCFPVAVSGNEVRTVRERRGDFEADLSGQLTLC